MRDSRLGSAEDTVAITVAPAGNRLVLAAGDLPRAIPDSLPAGITSAIAVTQNRLITDMKVRVEIDHTWRGDLRVELLGPGGFTKTLHSQSGGSEDDLRQTFLVPEAVGRSTAGTWSLRAADLAPGDTGVLEAWQLDFGAGALPSNRPPLASAGAGQTVSGRSTVTLSGARSSDPDGDPLSFEWLQLAGPPIVFAPSATARDVTFSAPSVAANTDVRLRLRVRDGRGAEADALVTITVTSAGGGSLEVRSTDTPLDIPDANPTGIASTILVAQDGDIHDMSVTIALRHTWISDLRVTLEGPGGFVKVLHDRTGAGVQDIRRTFPVPEAIGRRTDGSWRLRVEDHVTSDVGALESWSMAFSAGAAADNQPPLALAGSDRTVLAGATVALSGAGSSDPNGDPLSFQWAVVSGPQVTFAPSATSRDVQFQAPAVVFTTTLVIKLTVRDGRGGLAEGTVRVTVAAAGAAASHLVINEIDYDQVGDDNAEFVEIFNGTAASVDLSRLAVVFVNGADNSEYRRVVLSGTLAAGQYLVLAPPGLPLASPAARRISTGFETSNAIQNGPDAVGILDLPTGQLVDALSYEGPVSAGLVTGAGARSFVEGALLGKTNESSDVTSAGSLVRRPNGTDSNSTATDFTFSPTPTPGAANPGGVP